MPDGTGWGSPNDQLQQAIKLSQTAGTVPTGGPGETPQLSGSAGTPQGQAQAGAWRQIAANLPEYAKYAMLGAAGGQGGTGGALAAAGIAAMLAMQKRHKFDASAGKIDGKIATSSGSPSVTAAGGDTDGWKKGGKVNSRRAFGGEISQELMKRPRMTKPHVQEIPQGLDTKARVTTPTRIRVPKADQFRASGTGRYVRGGLVRGAGAAIRGSNFKGEY